MLSKRYKSTEVDRRTWLHVPLVTHWSLFSLYSAKIEPEPKIVWQKLDFNLSNLLKMLKMNSLPFTSKKINSGKTCQLKKRSSVTSLYIFFVV